MSKVEISTPKTRIIEWLDCVAIVENGKIESCTDIKLQDALKEDAAGFAFYVCSIVACMKDTSPAKERKARKDKGTHRNIESNASTSPIISIERPTIVSDPLGSNLLGSEPLTKPKRTRKVKGVPIITIEEERLLSTVTINGEATHGKTLREAATFALEASGYTLSALDKFEQTPEVIRLKEALSGHE